MHAALVATVRRTLEEVFRQESLPVPPQKSQALVERVTEEVSIEIERSGSYAGPMPPPPMMGDFDEVVPGLAREIADAAHEERKHRHKWERRALWNDIFVESGGLFLGWALAIGCAAMAGFLALKENNIGAGIMLTHLIHHMRPSP
jgi:uncharacterized membrane protein